jgi:hypothetical protein
VDDSSNVDERVNVDEEMKRHRTKLTRPIHNLWKILEWEMVDQVLLIARVWPLRKNEPDRPFDDRIDDARYYLSHLDDLLMMEDEEGGTLLSARSRYGF